MKLTRLENAVMQVVDKHKQEVSSAEIYIAVGPIAFGKIHRVLDKLVKHGLIEERREGEKRIVRRANEVV